MKTFLLTILSICIAGMANAATIDFNSNPDAYYWYTPVTSNGFVFSDITGEGSLGTAANLDWSSVDNGTVHLMDWNNKYSLDYLSSLKMQAADSSLFSLDSFEFTSGYLNGSDMATQLSVSGFDLAGNLITNAIFTSAQYSNSSFTKLTLNDSFQNLSYVTFDAAGLDNRVGYDNIVVNENAPVPEPGTMMLLGIGMGGLALYGKRRKNSKG